MGQPIPNVVDRLDVAVVILARNEEHNVARSVSSVAGDFAEVFVIDSGSTDRTRELAAESGAQVVENPWPGFAAQRNWGIDHLPLTATWIFFLDADEYVDPAFVAELRQTLARTQDAVAGFSIRRTLEWGNAKVAYGGIQDTRIVRIFRRGRGRCDDRAVNEHIVLDGVEATLEVPVGHRNESGLRRWIDKHLVYSRLEAKSLLDELVHGDPTAQGPSALTRLRRRRMYAALPPFLRVAARFGYSMTLQHGYRDGLPASSYYLLHHLLYPLLTDVHFVAEATRRLAQRGKR